MDDVDTASLVCLPENESTRVLRRRMSIWFIHTGFSFRLALSRSAS